MAQCFGEKLVSRPAGRLLKQPAVSRAVPVTRKGKATRSRLLQAAEAEFGARGYHEASVGGVAARALVSAGTFYLYFVSKEEIFSAVLSDVGDRVRAVLGDELQGGPEASADRVQTYLRYLSRDQCVCRIVQEAAYLDRAAYQRYLKQTNLERILRVDAGLSASRCLLHLVGVTAAGSGPDCNSPTVMLRRALI